MHQTNDLQIRCIGELFFLIVYEINNIDNLKSRTILHLTQLTLII